MLQLSVSLPQIIDLLLQSLQSSFSSTHCLLFLISDQPYQLRAESLNGADELSKDALGVLHRCLCGALLHTQHRQLYESKSGSSVYQLLFFCTNSPYETPQPLSAPPALSLSAGFSPDISLVSPSEASVHRDTSATKSHAYSALQTSS